jgi:hypothetical protein
VSTDKDSENLATKEIASWKGFEYALRNPNASLFNQMLKECLENEEYEEAFKTKGQQYSAESLFVALIFQQQKAISRLLDSLGSNQETKRKMFRRKALMSIESNPRTMSQYD